MTISTKGIALVTGASAGIGAVYAERLAHRGYDLILVARNRARLDDLAKRLAGEARTVEVVTADLNDKADLSRIETLLRTDGRITMLVNSAGVSAAGPLLTSDIDAMDDMIALNITALTRLTYAAAPGFVARGGGPHVGGAGRPSLAFGGQAGPVRVSHVPGPAHLAGDRVECLNHA